ncbi:hypothetical protein J6590_078981 [Homalodisca vitripennis]|nr:hypothetical protein J6590_078981 [Homalodisca vitripennis]
MLEDKLEENVNIDAKVNELENNLSNLEKNLRLLKTSEISSEPKQAGLTNKTKPISDRAQGPMVLSAPRSELPIFEGDALVVPDCAYS